MKKNSFIALMMMAILILTCSCNRSRQQQPAALATPVQDSRTCQCQLPPPVDDFFYTCKDSALPYTIFGENEIVRIDSIRVVSYPFLYDQQYEFCAYGQMTLIAQDTVGTFEATKSSDGYNPSVQPFSSREVVYR